MSKGSRLFHDREPPRHCRPTNQRLRLTALKFACCRSLRLREHANSDPLSPKRDSQLQAFKLGIHGHMFPDDLRVIVIYILRVYLLLTSASLLIARAIPQLRKAFIPYGKTYNGSPYLTSMPYRLFNISVSKSWFWHFYLLSTSLSIAWGAQFVMCTTGGQLCLYKWLSLINGKTFVCWLLMFLHGVRRFYETVFIQKARSARMWIGHYLVGCAFYSVMSITVFIEGLKRPTGILATKVSLITEITLRQSIFDSIDRYSLSAIALFISASIWQYHVHSTLASLRAPETRKVTYLAPPSSNLSFQLFLTPHYTAEILIYLALTLQLRNWTIFCALIWVVTNLSVSAGETRVWARSKFREHQWGRWNLIPYLY